jgi:hypothetical protein
MATPRWLVEHWVDSRTGNVVLRVHEPVEGDLIRAGMLVVSASNAEALLDVLERLPAVDSRRVPAPATGNGRTWS